MIEGVGGMAVESGLVRVGKEPLVEEKENEEDGGEGVILSVWSGAVAPALKDEDAGDGVESSKMIISPPASVLIVSSKPVPLNSAEIHMKPCSTCGLLPMSDTHCASPPLAKSCTRLMSARPTISPRPRESSNTTRWSMPSNGTVVHVVDGTERSDFFAPTRFDGDLGFVGVKGCDAVTGFWPGK